jgi:hypothetical protein
MGGRHLAGGPLALMTARAPADAKKTGKGGEVT